MALLTILGNANGQLMGGHAIGKHSDIANPATVLIVVAARGLLWSTIYIQ